MRIPRVKKESGTVYCFPCGRTLFVPYDRDAQSLLRGDGYRVSVSRQKAAAEVRYERAMRSA
jgi:hypothetical protein